MAIKTFSALPSWNDIEQSPTYQELDQPQRKEYFDRWQSTFTEVATEDPDNITPEVWDGFKKFRQQKSRDLTGASGLTAANAEAEDEAQTEAPSRVQLAARKRELEAKSGTFMGGTDLTRLQEEERTELANLRNVVAATDEDDLDAIEKVANDDQDFHVADGAFFASPKLALDSQRYRETVRNNKALTPEQKVEALMRGRSLREETGARLKADIDAADMAFEDTWLGGMDKFRAFERDVREGNPDATDADIMEKWQKENGAWYSNLGTQMKIGGLQSGAQLVGTYYGLKSMAGIDTEDSLLMGQAAAGVNEQLAGASKATGGATLAADATSMVLTSLATAPAGLAGRGIVAAGRGLVSGAGRFAAAATAGRVGTSALVRAATLKAGGEAAAKITARQVALATTGGLAASAFAAGVQSAGGAFNQYFDQFLKEELDAVPEADRTPQFVEESRRRARDGARARALVSGAVTAVITAGFGATGAEKLAAPQFSKAAQAAKEGMVVFLGKSLSKEALSEAGEEGLDALANGIIDKATVSPGKPIEEIVEETLKAAAAGGLLGAGMSAPFAVADAFKARSDAKKNPAVAGLEQTAANLRNNGASMVAGVVSEMAGAMTQEQLDAKAAADTAAAADILNQPEEPPIDAGLQNAMDEGAPTPIPIPIPIPTTDANKAPVNVIPAEEAPAPVEEAAPAAPKRAAPVPRVPTSTQPTPAQTNDTETKEPPTSSVPPVEGQPPVEQAAGQVEEGTPPGPRQGKPGKTKAVTAKQQKVKEAVDLLLGRTAPAPAVVEEAPAPAAPVTPSSGNFNIDSTDPNDGFVQVITTKNTRAGDTIKGEQGMFFRSTKAEDFGAKKTGQPEGAWRVSILQNEDPLDHFSFDTQEAAIAYAQSLADRYKKRGRIVESLTRSAPATSAPAPAVVEEAPAPAPAPEAAIEGAGSLEKPKADSRSKVLDTLTPPQQAAIGIIAKDMLKSAVIPSSTDVSSKLLELTKKGLSNGDPRLKQLVAYLRDVVWAGKFPPESGEPAGFLTGANRGSPLIPLPKTRSSIMAAGGYIPFKIVSGKKVGFFTNIPVDAAKQLNGGLVVTIPEELRGSVHKDITFDKATGVVTEVIDRFRGVTPVKNPGDWTKLYNNSTQKADRAAALLQAGANVAEETGKTLEELMAELIVANNKLVAASTGQIFMTLSQQRDLRNERAKLIKDTRKMMKEQSPRIPLVGTDLYLLQHNPNPIAGEEALLAEYLRLGGETSSGGSYVENLVREILTVHAFTTVMDLEEQIQAAVRNRATHLVREALKQNPSATIDSLKKDRLPRVAFDVIERFADSSKAYQSVISGSLDDTLTTEDSVTADLAEEVAQVEIGTRDTLLDYQAAADTPLTAEETEVLKGALQDDPLGESLLMQNPFQARSALRAIKDGRLFKVGPDGVLLFEHGPELNKEELAGLEKLLFKVEAEKKAPEGVKEQGMSENKAFSTRLTQTPNVARFLFDLASLVRDALKNVTTEVGVTKFTDAELQAMNLEELFKLVHVDNASAAALIVDGARQNLEKFTSSSSLTTREANKLLSALLKGKPAPTAVRGETVSAGELAKIRAVEESVQVDAAVEMAQTTVDNVDQSLRALDAEIKTSKDQLEELRGVQKTSGVTKETTAKINKLNVRLNKLQEGKKDAQIEFDQATKNLEEATRKAAAKAKLVAAAPPKAVVTSAAQRLIAAAEARAANARKAVTSPAPTKAVNAGLGMKPLNPEPRITPAQKAAFVGELSAIGLTTTSDIASVYDALKRLSVKENSGNPNFKALSRLFTEQPTLFDGLNGFQIIDAPALAQDVSVVKGILTINVAAMTPTLDGTPRGPEALLRGLITHATTTLTAPDAVLNQTQRTALANLEALRQEAIDVEAATRPPGLESRYPSALKDTASFVQAMLTSPEFSGMLQTYQTKIVSPGLKSAWGRFWAAVGELFTGKRVMAGSGLHAGLMAAGSLMNNSPSADKVFLDSVRAIIANPLVAFPLTRTAGAKEVSHINQRNEAVEAADDPQSVATVEARVAGDDSPESDPKGLGEDNMKLLPVNAILGAAPDGGVQLLPRVADQLAVSSEALTEQQALAGLSTAISTVTALDNIARGNPALNNEGDPEFAIQLDLTSPEAIREALTKINEAIERLKSSSASNKDQFISMLEDMREFLELQANGIVPPPAKFDGMSQTANDVDTESLPPVAEPLPEQPAEEELSYAKPYVEDTTEQGVKQSVDLEPFLRSAAAKTGRAIKMVDAGPGVPNQPLFVKHDRSDTTIYVNKSALETLVAQFRARGYSTAEMTTHLNALLDREASTLAILQRFSSGELVATAKSLSYATRKKIIKRVYGLTPSDPGYSNYFARGTDVLTEDATADMVQLGADYFRMMRQISETGHTTEDVMEMVDSSTGTFARTVAFMRATSRQFMTWWRAYGDVNATRAILNIDSFLEASFAPPSSLSSSVRAAPQKEIPQKHEAKKLVSNYTGRTVDEVLDDAKLLNRVRESMKNEALGRETRQTTPLTVKQARKFVADLGLVSRDPRSVATALARIADMETVNPALRVIARQLSQHPNVQNLNDLTFVTGTSTQVYVNGVLTSAAGVYDSALHSLELNLPFMLERFKYSSKAQVDWSESYIVEVLIHEAAHAATTNLVAKYEAGAKLSAKVTQAIKGLDRLRLALSKQKGAEKFDYQLSNIDEYIAGVMTDTRFVEWISTMPNSIGNNLPGETGNRSLIKRILSRIYQIIFPDLEIDSVLEKSLSRVFDIAAHPHIVAKPNAKLLEGSYKTRLFETVTEREEAKKAAEEQAKLMNSEYDNETADIEESMSAEVDEEPNDPEQDLLEEANEYYAGFDEQMKAYEKGLASGKYAPTPPRRFAPAPLLPGAVTGERKTTEALKNSLPVMPPRVADYLKESTYFSGVAKLDLELIQKLIGPSIAGAVGPADFASIFLSLNDNSLPLTDAQRQLSRVVLGSALNRRINDMQEAMTKSPSSGGFAYMRDFEDVAKNVWHTIQDVASDSGQMLSVMAIARELINPRYVAASYRDAATKVNGKKLPKEVDDTFSEMQDEAAKAAEVAVKKSPLKKKIVEAMTKASDGDPADVQMMFDFMTTMQDYLDRGTGVPIPAKMAEWVSEQMLGMLDAKMKAEIKKVADAAGVPTTTFFEEYSDEVKRLVADRINQAILDATPETAALTDAQKEEAKRKALKDAIQEMVSSFEFAPSVERALNESRAKILARLEAEKGSSPEALQRYADAKAAVANMTYDLVPLHKAANIVRRSFEMQDQIYLSMTDRNANVAALAATISKAAGLSKEQSAKVAEAFKSAYEAELNRRIQKVMTNYSKRVAGSTLQGRGAAERYSRSERFMRLARLGGLRKEEFYNAMAMEFGLPSYNPAIADELDREAERIMAMPVGSVQRADATRDMNARIVNETYKTLMEAYGAKAVVKDHGMAWEYLAGIPVAMWKSGVLSGFGSMEVNFAYGTVQSIMDLGFNSMAYAAKAKDSKLATSNLMTMMKAIGWIADPAQRPEVWTEMKRAALTGRTRFASEQSESMLVLERDVPAIDVPVIKQLMTGTKNFFKLLGRVGSVIDATVSVPAAIARQRLALNYALTMSGADRAKIAEVMKNSFSPDELVNREISEILESEREQFRNTPRPDLAMESRRYQLLEQRRAQTYAELTSRLDANAKEDYLEASRESARFANLGTTPTGVAGWIFDGLFGTVDRKTKGLSSIIVSFPRAMGNLLDFSLAMSVPGLSFARANNVSPSSWFMSEENRYKREKVELGSIKYHKLNAQGLVAFMVQATIGTLYAYGLEDEEEGRVPWFMAYGKGYPDAEKNRQLRYRQPNWSPYTVKIGDLYLSWKDLPGFNLLLGGLASITDRQMMNSQKDPSKINWVENSANASVAFIKAVTVKNSMQGLAQAGELLSDNDLAEAMTARNLVSMATNFVSGATNPRLIRDVTEIGRGIAGGGEYTLKDTRGFTAAAISLLPANTIYGDALGQRDMVNAMGRPVTNFWFAPLTKRILPVSASDNLDPIITPLVSAGLFISPVKSTQMSFDTYKDDSDEVDLEGGPLYRFGPEVEAEAIRMFGENMAPMMSAEFIKDLTDQASQGRKGKEEAQDRLNDVCKKAKADVKAVIQERIFARELLPDWQQK